MAKQTKIQKIAKRTPRMSGIKNEFEDKIAALAKEAEPKSYRINSAAKKHLTRATPKETKKGAIVSRLRKYNDTSAAILGAVYVEDALEQLLAARFVRLSKDDYVRLFDGGANAPLGTFSAKIRLGFALGLYGPNTNAELFLLNDIRNAFAHSMLKVSFKTKEVVDDCQKFSLLNIFFKKHTGFDAPYKDAKAIYCEMAEFLSRGLIVALIGLHGDYAISILERIKAYPDPKTEPLNQKWGELV